MKKRYFLMTLKGRVEIDAHEYNVFVNLMDNHAIDFTETILHRFDEDRNCMCTDYTIIGQLANEILVKFVSK